MRRRCWNSQRPSRRTAAIRGILREQLREGGEVAAIERGTVGRHQLENLFPVFQSLQSFGGRILRGCIGPVQPRRQRKARDQAQHEPAHQPAVDRIHRASPFIGVAGWYRRAIPAGDPCASPAGFMRRKARFGHIARHVVTALTGTGGQGR